MQSLEINPPNNVRVSFTTNKALPPTLILSNGFASNALSLSNASNVELISYDTQRRDAHGLPMELQHPAPVARRNSGWRSATTATS